MDKKLLMYGLIIAGLLVIIAALLVFKSEVKEAEAFCSSINGTYHLKYYHFCNDKPIYKFQQGEHIFWGFERNLKDIKLNLSSVH